MTLEEQVRADPRFAAYSPAKQMQLVGLARQRDAATAPRPQGPTRSMALEALPVSGAILGGFAGGPLAPVTAGLGAGIGEEAAQFIETTQGKRQAANIPDILKTAAIQGATEAVAGPALKLAGRGFQAGARGARTLGTKIVEATMPRSTYEANLVRAYRANTPFWQRVTAAFKKPLQSFHPFPSEPQTVAKTIVEKGLMGTEAGLGVQATRAARSLWKDLVKPALQQSQQRVPIPQFFDEIEQQIIRDTDELSRQADLIEALGKLKKTYENVADVPLTKLQRLKEGWEEFIPEGAHSGEPIQSTAKDVRDMAADKARTIIYDALGPDIRQAYFDYGNLKQVMKHGTRAMTGGKLRGGSGGLLSAFKDMAVTPVSTIGAQTVYRVIAPTISGVGKGMELIGQSGARRVADVIPGMFKVGKDVSGIPALIQENP